MQLTPPELKKRFEEIIAECDTVPDMLFKSYNLDRQSLYTRDEVEMAYQKSKTIDEVVEIVKRYDETGTVISAKLFIEQITKLK